MQLAMALIHLTNDLANLQSVLTTTLARLATLSQNEMRRLVLRTQLRRQENVASHYQRSGKLKE